MGTWRNSKSFTKRFAFKSVACMLSALLCVTLIHSQSLSYLRSCAVSAFSSSLQAIESLAGLSQTYSQIKSESSSPVSNQATNNSSTAGSQNSSETTGLQNSSAVADLQNSIDSTTSQNSSESTELQKSSVAADSQNSSDANNLQYDNDTTTQDSSPSNDITSAITSFFAPQKAYADEPSNTDPEVTYNSGQYWWAGEGESEEEVIQKVVENKQGSGTESDPFLVSTFAQFKVLLANFPKAHFKFLNNIEITGWVARNDGSDNIFDMTFSGTVDGDGYTLSSNSALNDSVINTIENATFKNLTVNLNIDFKQKMDAFKAEDKSPNVMGLIASYAKGENKFESVNVKGYVENSFDDGGYNAKKIGAFIGEVSEGKTTFDSCSSAATVSVGGTAEHKAGGYIGSVASGGEVGFTACTFSGKVSSLAEGSEIANIFISATTTFLTATIETVRSAVINFACTKLNKSETNKNSTEDIKKKVLNDGSKEAKECAKIMEDSNEESALKRLNESEEKLLIDVDGDFISYDGEKTPVCNALNAYKKDLPNKIKNLKKEIDYMDTERNQLQTEGKVFTQEQYEKYDQLKSELADLNKTNEYFQNWNIGSDGYINVSKINESAPRFAKYLSTSNVMCGQDGLTFSEYFTREFSNKIVDGFKEYKDGSGNSYSDAYNKIMNNSKISKDQKLEQVNDLKNNCLTKAFETLGYNKTDAQNFATSFSNYINTNPSYYSSSNSIYNNPYAVKDYAIKTVKQTALDVGCKLLTSIPFVGPYLSIFKFDVWGTSGKGFKYQGKGKFGTDKGAFFSINLDLFWASGPFKSIADAGWNAVNSISALAKSTKAVNWSAKNWGLSYQDFTKNTENVFKLVSSVAKSFNYKGYIDNKSVKLVSNVIKEAGLTSKMTTQAAKKSKGAVGNIIKNELKKQLNEAIPEIRTMAKHDPEFKEIVGVEFYSALMETENSANLQGTDAYKAFEQYLGEIINERVYASIGEPILFSNIYYLNDSNVPTKDEDGCQANEEYLATLGQVLHSNKKYAKTSENTTNQNTGTNSNTDTSTTSNTNVNETDIEVLGITVSNNDYSDFYKTNIDLFDFADNKSVGTLEVLHDDLYRNYVKIGYEFVKFYMSETDENKQIKFKSSDNNPEILNTACSDSVSFDQSLNYARLFREASLELYYDERNATTKSDNLEYRGTPRFRKLINHQYNDKLEWSEFLASWGPDLYKYFAKNMATYNKWDINNLKADQKKLIQDFFTTYITYGEEFSYSNYLPSMRAMLYNDDFTVYTVDFLNDSATISAYWSDDEVNEYLPDGDRTWKSTDISPGLEHQLTDAYLHESNMFCSEESIDEVKDANFNLDQTLELIDQDYYKVFDDEDTNSSQAYSENTTTTTGVGIQNMVDSLASGLQTSIVSMAKLHSGITETSVVGTSHYNAYSGGYIGSLFGSVTFDECTSSGNVVGGTTAGGFIGYANEGSAVFHKSYNEGSICTSDELDPTMCNDIGLSDFQQAGTCSFNNKGWATSAGGYIGVSSKSDVTIEYSTTTGILATRQYAGGMIGYAYKGRVNVAGSAAISGVGAPDACGGIVGLLYGADLTVTDSYTCCAFDTQSNSDYTDSTINKWLPLFGLGTWDIATKLKQLSNEAGSFVGSSESGSSISLENVYHLNDGSNLVRSDSSYNDYGNAFSYSDLSSGNVCYKLNRSIDYNNLRDGQSATPSFGQIINDFSKGEKQEFPVAGSSVYVYKDLLCNTNDAYTNFDPRRTETHVVEFEKNNSTTNPDVLSMAVKSGDDFVFSATPKSGYKIDSVEYLDSSNDIKTLTPTASSGTTSTYKVPAVKENITIVIYTTTLSESQPVGTGRIGDPYLIYTAPELLWFNNRMKETPYLNAQVKLMADIDYSAFKWTPIYSDREGGGFAGVFDGNGHKITGLSIPKDGENTSAFFKGLEGTEDGEAMYDWSFISNTYSVKKTVKSVDAEGKEVTNTTVQTLDDQTVEDLIENNSNVYLVVNPKSSKRSGDYAHNTYIKALLNDRIIDKDENAGSGQDSQFKSDLDVMQYVESKAQESQGDDKVYIAFVNRSSYEQYKGENGIQDFHVVKELLSESGVVRNLTLGGSFGDAALTYYAKNAKIENVNVTGTVTASADNAVTCGSIVSIATGNVEILNCTNSAKVDFWTNRISFWQSFGGILGKYTKATDLGATTDEGDYNLTIKNCKNTAYLCGNSSSTDNIGNTTWEDYVYGGGIVGSIVGSETQSNNLNVLIEGCTNTGNIGEADTSTTFIGGIIGGVASWKAGNNNVVVNNCSVSGNLGYDASGRQSKCADCGGVVGRIDDGDVKVKVVNSIISGNVYAGTGRLYGEKSWEVAEKSVTANIVLGCVMTVAGIGTSIYTAAGGEITKKLAIALQVSSAVPTLLNGLFSWLGHLWTNGEESTYAGMIVGEETDDSVIEANNCLITGKAESMNYLYNADMTIEKNVFANQDYKASDIYYLDQGLSTNRDETVFCKLTEAQLSGGEAAYKLDTNADTTGYEASFGQNIDNINGAYVAQTRPVVYDKKTTQKVYKKHDWETEYISYTNNLSSAVNAKKTDKTKVYINTEFEGEGYVDGPAYVELNDDSKATTITLNCGSKNNSSFETLEVNDKNLVSAPNINNDKEIKDNPNQQLTLDSKNSYICKDAITLTIEEHKNNELKISCNKGETQKQSVSVTVAKKNWENSYKVDLTAKFTNSQKPKFEDKKGYLISNARELVWFRNNVNSGNIEDWENNAFITEDIVIPENSDMWNLSIGSDSNPYGGTFDGFYNGQRHKITNNNQLPLFNVLNGATIKNLDSEKTYCADSDTSFISNLANTTKCSEATSSIESVDTYGNISGVSNIASGFVACVQKDSNLSIKNSTNYTGTSVNKVSSGNRAEAFNKTLNNYGLSKNNGISNYSDEVAYGGFVGVSDGKVIIESSSNYGWLSSQSTEEGSLGGCVGLSLSSSLNTIRDFNNKGVIAGYEAGGVIGKIQNTKNTNVSSIERAVNDSSLTSFGTGGGIVGRIDHVNFITLNGCSNYGMVTGVNCSVGGIVGFADNSTLDLTNIINNSSNISTFCIGSESSSRYAGGIVGCIHSCSINTMDKVITKTENLTSDMAVGHLFGGFLGTTITKNAISNVWVYSKNADNTSSNIEFAGIDEGGSEIVGVEYAEPMSFTTGELAYKMGSNSNSDVRFVQNLDYAGCSVDSAPRISGSENNDLYKNDHCVYLVKKSDGKNNIDTYSNYENEDNSVAQIRAGEYSETNKYDENKKIVDAKAENTELPSNIVTLSPGSGCRLSNLNVGGHQFNLEALDLLKQNNYKLDLTSYVYNVSGDENKVASCYGSNQQGGKYSVVNADVTYEIVEDEMPAYDSSTDTYLIENVKHLKWLSNVVNQNSINDSLSVKAKLVNDIDMEGFKWNAIGNSTNKYCGSFDGNGYNITGLTGSGALFGYTSNATIKDLSLEVAMTGTNESKDVAGVVVHAEGGTIDNVVVGGTLAPDTENGIAGGIAAYAGSGTYETLINNCQFEGTFEKGKVTAGIVGTTAKDASKQVTISNCQTLNSVKYSDYTNTIAGILGIADSTKITSSTLYITDCRNYSSSFDKHIAFTSKFICGGIVGTIMQGSFDNQYVWNCENYGDFRSRVYVGGIIGNYSKEAKSTKTSNLFVEGCHNSGQISSQSSSGGILGACNGKAGTYTINKCGDSGRNVVNGLSYCYGGIVGNTVSAVKASIQSSYSLYSKVAYNVPSYMELKNCYASCSADAGSGKLAATLAGTDSSADAGSNQNSTDSTFNGFWGQKLDTLGGGSVDAYPKVYNDQSYRVYKVPSSARVATTGNGIDAYTNTKFEVESDHNYMSPCSSVVFSESSNYQILTQTNDGNLVDLGGKFSPVEEETHQKLGSMFVISPKDGFYVTSIKINGSAFDSNKIKASDLVSGGYINYVEVNVSTTPTPLDYVQPKNSNNNVGSVTINEYCELLWLANEVQQYSENQSINVTIAKSIDYEQANNYNQWKPIGTEDHPFRGTFKGKTWSSETGQAQQIPTISGLVLAQDSDVGIFGYAENATIQDLIFHENFTSNDNCVSGVVVNANNVTIKNVFAYGTLSGEGEAVGGIVANLTGGNNFIDGCSSNFTITEPSGNKNKFGGIVAYVDSGVKTLTISNSCNFSGLQSNREFNGFVVLKDDDYCGGIIGAIENTEYGNIDVVSCANFGKVIGDTAGGIIGYTQRLGGGSKLNLVNCENYGVVAGDYMGGILGRASDYGKYRGDFEINLNWCNNYGFVGVPQKKVYGAGGIVGFVKHSDVTLNMNYCNNNASVNAGSSDINANPLANGSLDFASQITSLVTSSVSTASSLAVTIITIVGVVGGSTGVGTLVSVAVGLVFSVVNLISNAFNYKKKKKQNRWGDETWAGGLIAQSKATNNINYSMNLGNVFVIDKSKKHNVAKDDIIVKGGLSDSSATFTVTGGQTTINGDGLTPRNTITWDQLNKGQIAWLIQRHDESNGKLITADGSNEKNVKLKNISSSVIDSLNSTSKSNTNVINSVADRHYGQNLDKPTEVDSYGNTQVIMSSPSYKIPSELYPIYKHELIDTNDYDGSSQTRTVYSNWPGDETFISYDEFVTVKGNTNAETSENNATTEVANNVQNSTEPLAKLFDVVLNGGRSLMSVIPDYESEYTWNSFEKKYSLLPQETAEIQINKSALNGKDNSQEYLIKDLTINLKTKQDWSESVGKHWYEKVDGQYNYVNVEKSTLDSDVDLFGGTVVELKNNGNTIEPVDSNITLSNNTYFVNNAADGIAKISLAQPQNNPYAYYAKVSNSDGSIDKIANPVWESISTKITNAKGEEVTVPISTKLVSYDYMIKVKSDSSTTVYLNKVDLNTGSDDLHRESEASKGDVRSKYIPRNTIEVSLQADKEGNHKHTIGESTYTTEFKEFDLDSTKVYKTTELDNRKISELDYYDVKSGSYVLTNDLVLEADMKVQTDSNVNLCLDGHNINLNGHKIDVIGNSTLNVVDCNDINVSHIKKTNEDGSFSYCEEQQSKGLFDTYGDSLISGGIIYDGSNAVDDASKIQQTPLFVVGNTSALNLYSGTVDISNRNFAINTEPAATKAKVYVNNNFCGNTENSIANINVVSQMSEIKFGVDYNSKVVSSSYTNDIYVSSEEKDKLSNIEFSNTAKLSNKIRIKTPLESQASSMFGLSGSFDKYVAQGIDPAKLFEIEDEGYSFAYGNDNSLFIAKAAAIIKVDVTADSDEGKSFPVGSVSDSNPQIKQVNYISDASPKIYYKSNGSSLYNLSLKDSKDEEKVIDKGRTCASSDSLKDLTDGYYQFKTSTTDSDGVDRKIFITCEFDDFSASVADIKTWKPVDNGFYSVDNMPGYGDNDVAWGYRLTEDISSKSVFIPASGRTVIDLNGHSIKSAANASEDQNLFHLSNEDSQLVILDRSNGGGSLQGCNVVPNRYYLYEETCGAVVVDEGTFCLKSGTIRDNSGNGILGGAAITVGENGKAFVKKEGTIENNSIVGDNTYESDNFSAAISVEGFMRNSGTISNNTSNKYATSAVNVSGTGEFVNDGTIKDNVAMQDKTTDNLDSFGAIKVGKDAKFTNKGYIGNNKADFATYAIVNEGTMSISGESQISNNHALATGQSDSGNTGDDSSNKLAKDIYTTTSLNITGQLTKCISSKDASVVECGNKKGAYITSGWANAYKPASYYFKSPDPEIYIYAHGNNDEIYSTSQDAVCNLKFESTGDNGSNNVLTSNIYEDDLYSKNAKFDVKLSNGPANFLPYKVEVVGSNSKDKSAATTSDIIPIKVGDAEFMYPGIGWSDKDTYTVKVAYGIEYTKGSTDTKNKLIPYTNKHKLPEAVATYYLQNDITLDYDYDVISSTNTKILLNGYTINKGNGQIKVDENIAKFESNKLKNTDNNDIDKHLSFNDYSVSNFSTADFWTYLSENEIAISKSFTVSNASPLTSTAMPNMSQSQNTTSDGYIIWDSDNSLPENAGKYRLQKDIVLEDTWYAPQGSTEIDLNSYNITIAKENANIIYLSDSSCDLKISDCKDSSNNVEDKNYLSIDDDGNATIQNAKPSEGMSVELNGGVIGGAKFKNNDESGAIYVAAGKLDLVEVNVAANVMDNSVDGLFGKSAKGQGAAGITVKSGASATFGARSRICYNKAISANDQYSYGIAAVKVNGNVVNTALIDNNRGLTNSVAGVGVSQEGASFVNNGLITNNVAYDRSIAGVFAWNETGQEDNSMKLVNNGMISSNQAAESSLAAVYAKTQFENTGIIQANCALDEDSFPGVYTTQPLKLDGESSISRNVNIYDESEEDVDIECENLDEFESSSDVDTGKAILIIGDNYQMSRDTSGNLEDKNKVDENVITYLNVSGTDASRNVSILNSDVVSNLNSTKGYNFLVSSNESYDLCLSTNGDLVFKSVYDVSSLHVSTTEGGTASVKGDVAFAKDENINFPIDIKSDSGKHIKSITVTTPSNTSKVDVPANAKEYTYMVDDTSFSKDVHIEFEADPVANVANAPAVNVYKDWSSTNSLPYSAGSYKLTRDVVLPHTWYAPQGTTQIDLNGHNITISHDETIMALIDSNAVLEILDTNKNVENRFKVDPNTGVYTKDPNGTEVFKGGVIYGGKGENGGAFMTQKSTYLALYGVNVVANSAKVGGAIFNSGSLVVGEGSYIVGNNAEIAGAIYNDHLTVFTNAGTISNNVASDIAGGIYANFLVSFSALSKVTNNFVIKKTVDKQNNETYQRSQDDVVVKEYVPTDNYRESNAINIIDDPVDKDTITYVTCIRQDDLLSIPVRLFSNAFFTDKIKKGVYIADDSGTYKLKVDENTGRSISKQNLWKKK